MNTSKDSAASIPILSNRRDFLRRAGLAGAVAAVAPTAAAILSGNTTARADEATDLDVAVLTFALNLEYLEAEFYSYAFYGDGSENHGAGIDGIGTTGTTSVKPNFAKVPFANPLVEAYAKEITQDEINHVIFLRAALEGAGITPVARPNIDLYQSFNTAAQAAGIGPAFDPFADDVSFLLGSFVFEDVGVTAYHGGARLITNKTYLGAAAGILAVEAYHAGIIRTTLYALNEQANDGGSIAGLVQKISDLRDALDGSTDKDQGILNSDGSANLVPTDASSIAFARSTRKVLNIVYGAVHASSGLFYPNGLNGPIK